MINFQGFEEFILQTSDILRLTKKIINFPVEMFFHILWIDIQNIRLTSYFDQFMNAAKCLALEKRLLKLRQTNHAYENFN